MPRFGHLLSIMGKDERVLPLKVDFINYHGVTAHIKLPETGTVEDTARVLAKGYGDCDVKSFEITDIVSVTLHRKH